MQYKIFIPSAGIGSRVVNETQNQFNKALIDLGNKKVIGHIVEQFDPNTSFVVALGFLGKGVRDYLTANYPHRTFEFVEIENYDGPGSGLGHTMLMCYEHLHCPFIFISNDTLVQKTIPEPKYNWMGYANGTWDMSQFRSLRVNSDSQVTELCEKGATGEVFPYIGLAGIYDYQRFWQAMQHGNQEEVTAIGESFGLRQMISQGIQVKAQAYSWHDTGNLVTLQLSRNLFGL